MAEKENGNLQEPEEQEPPQFNMVGQYIKKLTFESPNSPGSLSGPGENPNLQIGVNVNVQKLASEDFEVTLDLKADAKNDDGEIYQLDLVYAGIFRLRNVPQEAVRPLLLINCPTLIFPFARRLVVDITREGGFPPLSLDPIDFAALFRNKMQAQQQQKQESSAPN